MLDNKEIAVEVIVTNPNFEGNIEGDPSNHADCDYVLALRAAHQNLTPAWTNWQLKVS